MNTQYLNYLRKVLILPSLNGVLILLIITIFIYGCVSDENSLKNDELNESENTSKLFQSDLGYIIELKKNHKVEFKRRIQSPFGGYSTEEWIDFDSLNRPSSFRFLSAKLERIDSGTDKVVFQFCSSQNFDGAFVLISQDTSLLKTQILEPLEKFDFELSKINMSKLIFNVEFTTINKSDQDTTMVLSSVHKSFFYDGEKLIEKKYDGSSENFDSKISEITGLYYSKWW